MASNLAWLTTIFCPLLGVVINNAKGLAPIKALILARKNKKLGPLSPIPFALITNNCVGWTLYAILNGDYFIFMSNCFSMILGFGLCLTALHILEHTDNGTNPIDNIIRLKVEGILMISSMFWLSIVFITCLVLRDPKYNELNITIVGSFSDICSLVFYAAPLTNIKEIVRKKDSSSLYAPAIFINFVSCILWFFYGLYGISQKIVWIPNGIGIAVCIFELYICWHYPPLPSKVSDGVNFDHDHYRHHDFAVYASSRHMSISLSEVAPLLDLSSVSSKRIVDGFNSSKDEPTSDSIKCDSKGAKYRNKAVQSSTSINATDNPLVTIPEENVHRGRSYTTSDVDGNESVPSNGNNNSNNITSSKV